MPSGITIRLCFSVLFLASRLISTRQKLLRLLEFIWWIFYCFNVGILVKEARIWWSIGAVVHVNDNYGEAWGGRRTRLDDWIERDNEKFRFIKQFFLDQFNNKLEHPKSIYLMLFFPSSLYHALKNFYFRLTKRTINHFKLI